MDYSEHREAFDRDGYVVVPGFLSPPELAELNREMRRFIDEVVPVLPDTQVFYETAPDGTKMIRQILRLSCDPYFESYQRRPGCVALARTFVGEDVVSRPPMYFTKPLHTDFPTPPHQDNCAFGLDPPNGVEMLLAMEERFDEENGCLRYLPGSHLEGLRPHRYSGVRGFAAEVADYGPEDEEREVAVVLQPGDVLCHHPLVIHRADRNRSRDRQRPALSLWFRGVSTHVEPTSVEDYDEHARRAQMAGR